ncbi:imidazoleglycerol-phosphate dehydratase HisB [Poriferisphaera sp. WC338]|uniref:imidazoleglycerol-phosphate dehydratase HisB n=1 Tax=Poriferisphaera sp. WC338 TaxID=3425129 RepID=UPI003D81A806
MSNRTANIKRKTNETDIKLALDLDGGSYTHDTGVGFFDHMLDHIARHGQLGLNIKAVGDTHVDDHHTVEDVGIVLGQAIEEALGDKRGIERYGSADVPMDESLARVALDLSGRPALVFNVCFKSFGSDPAKIGQFDVQLVKEFFNAVVNNAKMNLHIEVPWGENNHHIAEAIFKAFGRALRQAIRVTGDQIPSTKGSL